MALLFALVLVQIFARSIGVSVPQTEELTRYTLTTLTALALYPWERSDETTTGLWTRARHAVGKVIALIVLAITFIGAVDLTLQGLDQTLSTLDVSIAWIYGAATLGIGLAILAELLHISSSRR